MTPDSILNVDVSAYQDYETPQPKTVNLLTFLQSPKYRDKADTVKIAPDKKTRDAIKATLPAITPSGIFTRRGEENLQSHTGFIQFDIDPKGNDDFFGKCETLEDYEAVTSDIKRWLQDLPFVAYAAVSVSGRGVWGLVPLSDPTQHKAHFRSMQKDFAQMGLKIDNLPSNVASLRGYSYDPEAYFNHHAEKYTGKEEVTRTEAPPRPEPVQRTEYPTDSIFNDTNRVEALVKQISQSGRDITSGYENWFKVAGSLASEFGEGGRQYFHDLSRNNSEYDYARTDRQYTACLRGKGYTLATFYRVCQDHGFSFKDALPFPEKYDKLPGRIIQLPVEGEAPAKPAFDPLAYVLQHRFDITKPVVETPAVISLHLDNQIFGFLGEGMIGAVVGEEKAGKSTLINAIVASAVKLDSVLNVLAGVTKQIIYFDTEQPEYWFYRGQATIHNQAGIKTNSDRYQAYPMRRLTVKQRVEVIDHLLAGRKDLGLIVLDGIVDLCTDFNNERAASETIERLMQWSDETGATILTALHLTKGNKYMRGHLGSILGQKADGVIEVTHAQGEPDFGVKCRLSRYAPFPAWSFYRDRNGMPCLSHPDALPERQDDPYPVPVQMSMPIVNRRNDDDDIPF